MKQGLNMQAWLLDALSVRDTKTWLKNDCQVRRTPRVNFIPKASPSSIK